MGKVKRLSLVEALGLTEGTPASTLDRINRDIENLRTRLGSQGLDVTPPGPQRSFLSKTLGVLNVPGATVRGLIKAGIDPNYNITDIEPYDNPVEGIDILDALGLAPTETGTWGNKAARFGLGLATDLVTDPLSFLAGGITKPLSFMRAPVVGKTVATLTKQGVVQPFFRGLGAGLRSTGALGAAVGDEGVLAARKAATELAKQPGSKAGLAGAMRQVAPRPLTNMEKLGLEAGEKLRDTPWTRGAIGAVAKNAFSDPAYVSLQNRLARTVSREQKSALGQWDEMMKDMPLEDQRLVADLLESSGTRAQYGLEKMPALLGRPSATLVPRAPAAAAPTEAIGMPSLPSGRAPGRMLPAFEGRPTGVAADLGDRTTSSGKFVLEVAKRKNLAPTGLENSPLLLRQYDEPDLLQELVFQLERAYKGQVDGLGLVALELVRRGVWADATKLLPLGWKRVYEELLKRGAHPLLPRLIDSDAVVRESLQQTAARKIAQIPDRDARTLYGFWLDKTLADAVPLQAGRTISPGVIQPPVGTLPSGRVPGSILPEVNASATGNRLTDLPAEILDADGFFKPLIDSKEVIARTGRQVTPEALRDHSTTDLLQELAYQIQGRNRDGLRDVVYEMVRRGIWEDASQRFPHTLQQAYGALVTRGLHPLLPKLGASDDAVREFLRQRADDLLGPLSDKDERVLELLRVNATLRDAVPLGGAPEVVGQTVRTGETLGDTLTQQNLAAQQAAEGLTNKGIQATAPLQVARPGAEGTRSLFETQAVKELPPRVREAYEYARGALETYGNERLKRGLLGSLLQNYFPHKLKPEEGAGSGFGHGMTTNQQSAKFREIRQPVRNIVGKPGMPDFEHEAARPIAKEIVESIRSVEVFDFLDEVKRQFGVGYEDMAKRLGYVPTAKLADELGDYKLVDFAQFLVRGKANQAYAALGKVYLPKAVADDITRLHGAYNTDAGINTFMKLWDGATNFWKPLVTTLNLPFHVNNALGNLWNSFLGGLENPVRLRDGHDILFGRARELKAGAHKVNLTQIRELADKYGAVNAGFLEEQIGADVFRLVREGAPPQSEHAIAKTMQWIAGSAPGQAVGKAGQAYAGGMRKLGTYVEGVSRGALFTDQMLKRIAEHTGDVTGDVLDTMARQSADHVNKYLFDYAHGMSRFENEVVRRIAPFWAWTKNNVPLQVVELINQPGKFLAFKKVRDNLASINPPGEETPPWLQDALPTGIGLPGGTQLFFNPRLPLQDINRLDLGMGEDNPGRELLGMLNPLIKTPIELMAGERGFDFYTGRPIAEYAGQTTEILPGMRVGKKTAHLYNTMAGSVGRLATDVPEAFSQDADSVATLRAVRRFLPGVYTVNPQRQAVSNAYREVQRLQNLMRKYEDEEGKDVPTLRELERFGLASRR